MYRIGFVKFTDGGDYVGSAVSSVVYFTRRAAVEHLKSSGFCCHAPMALPSNMYNPRMHCEAHVIEDAEAAEFTANN